MTNDKLTVKTAPLDYTYGEQVLVELGEQIVFESYRFDEKSYSSTFWRVNDSGNKEDYFRRLISFYETLKSGNYEEKGKRGLPIGVKFNGKVRDNLPLELLLGENPELLKHPRFKDFKMLGIDTPYATFTMEDFSGRAWNSETGKIAIASHQDLSVPLAELIAETTNYSGSVEQLQSILAEKVYTFNQ